MNIFGSEIQYNLFRRNFICISFAKKWRLITYAIIFLNHINLLCLLQCLFLIFIDISLNKDNFKRF